jgi:hypothetical protein
MQKFDEATYRELAEALRERVAAHAPEWTNTSVGDPGVTLVELFAFLADALLYRASPLPPHARASAMRLAQSALALVAADAGTVNGTLERTHYFPGRLLGVDDFGLEQDYFRTRLRRLNRELHGSGIVRGLGVSVKREQAGQHVVIEPGFSIDAAGEEIEVPSRAMARLPQFGRRLHLILLHAERPTRPKSATDDHELPFTRIEEGFRICLDEAANGKGVALARLLYRNGGWHVDDAFEPPRVAKA